MTPTLSPPQKKLPFQHLRLPVLNKVIVLAEAVEQQENTNKVILKPTARDSLFRYLERLSEKSLAEVMALMWLGRCSEGESTEDFSPLVAQALPCLEDGPAYLAGKIPLAKYLHRGLRYLRESHSPTAASNKGIVYRKGKEGSVAASVPKSSAAVLPALSKPAKNS